MCSMNGVLRSHTGGIDMSKIICDVCGTRYPDTVEQCPICGYANVADSRKTAAEPRKGVAVGQTESVPENHTKVRGGRFSAENVRKRNQETNPKARYQEPAKSRPKQKRPEPEVLEEEEFEKQPREKGAVLLNILLVIVILALLAVTAYIAVEYFLPNVLSSDEEPEVTAMQILPSTDPTETESETETETPTVPCTGLTVVGFDAEEILLDQEGQAFLLNVAVAPQDTTDELTYASSDEDVVTVNNEGRLTAVSEGEATVYVVCGEQKLECKVRCTWSEPAGDGNKG